MKVIYFENQQRVEFIHVTGIRIEYDKGAMVILLHDHVVSSVELSKLNEILIFEDD